MSYELRYSQYNEYSILIEWPPIIDELILKSILNFKNSIQKKYIKQNIEVINTYNSLLVIYDLTIGNINDEIIVLKSLFIEGYILPQRKFTVWEIPVCYDEVFGVDMEDFSKEKGLNKSKIIELHSTPIYTVYFIGFLPGFLYLGGLNSKLFLDRKSTPSLNVKKGAVAIGGEQTGVYPQDSPGGWHIIGNSPIDLFDPNQILPCKIETGDMIKFVAISKQEHSHICCLKENSLFELKSKTLHA
ncbi:5-oxoprolinase subunit PxpB [Winogradskyella sp. PE311]|uniref:5-oxoprolinase subunit PxpB n=1 Tax=Winogradskyella sp. PE311 TaxID=3366943 RepID=UPI00397FDF07